MVNMHAQLSCGASTLVFWPEPSPSLVQAAKAVVRLVGCAGSCRILLLEDASSAQLALRL